ncbi:hypothetical protein [Micromonospora sp. NPDC002717]|uniref:hypothetical protein n=1 Tax=Micromonospora sp. NPDC002717 TaxID=3154424 RepID=UPI00332C958E
MDIALAAARAGPVQAAVLALLVLTLSSRIVVQLTGPARRKTLRILDMVAAPVLVAFVIIILQRFRDLS